MPHYCSNSKQFVPPKVEIVKSCSLFLGSIKKHRPHEATQSLLGWVVILYFLPSTNAQSMLMVCNTTAAVPWWYSTGIPLLLAVEFVMLLLALNGG